MAPGGSDAPRVHGGSWRLVGTWDRSCDSTALGNGPVVSAAVGVGLGGAEGEGGGSGPSPPVATTMATATAAATTTPRMIDTRTTGDRRDGGPCGGGPAGGHPGWAVGGA